MRPLKNIHNFLLSTPAPFCGEYENESLLVSIVFPGFGSPFGLNFRNPRDLQEGLITPNARYLMISFETGIPPSDQKSFSSYEYYSYGEFIANCLAVLYGKRVDSLGFIETQGCFGIPEGASTRDIRSYWLGPFNALPRVDLELPLMLDKISLIQQLIFSDSDIDKKKIFNVAAGFYRRSLQIVDFQPESAYLDLVTCGEILSDGFDIDPEELYGDKLNDIFESITIHIPEKSDKYIQELKGRLYQVRKKYRYALEKLVNTDYFLEHSETDLSLPGPPPPNKPGRFTKKNILKSISASYDLRSKYVHTGFDFGLFAREDEHIYSEVSIHKRTCSDKEIQSTLRKMPTFVGLERIMRFALLRYVHTKIQPIDDCLDG